MLTSDFDFDLPADLIAQHAVERGTSRLLVLDGDEHRHLTVADLPGILSRDDLLVVNNTRVIPARLFARRSTGGRVELLLVEQLSDRKWTALLKPGRRARPGTRMHLAPGLDVEVLDGLDDGRYRVQFSEPIAPHLATLGHVPLPPYIRRPDEAADQERYQTVYASVDGAIAAPTAGLHFTPRILDDLETAGVEVREVTLHVGIGTFKPVTVDLVHEHRMESERYEIPADVTEAVERTRGRGGRVVAVGTTVVRTLESAFDPADGLRRGPGRSELFITPGFEFGIVDALITNFHLPRSTLLMLVSALAGRDRMMAAYAEAIAQRYRFYSYGDAMFIDRRALGRPT